MYILVLQFADPIRLMYGCSMTEQARANQSGFFAD